jgi:predicted RNA binding protein YcfA (HicA-like mRNA interferase family)
MLIPYNRLKNLKAIELCRALERDGAVKDRQNGSHVRYVCSDGRGVSIPMHNKPIKVRTLKSIIEVQTRWSREDLIRLGLL